MHNYIYYVISYLLISNNYRVYFVFIRRTMCEEKKFLTHREVVEVVLRNFIFFFISLSSTSSMDRYYFNISKEIIVSQGVGIA